MGFLLSVSYPKSVCFTANTSRNTWSFHSSNSGWRETSDNAKNGYKEQSATIVVVVGEGNTLA